MARNDAIKFELPSKMEKVFAALSAYYKSHNKTLIR